MSKFFAFAIKKLYFKLIFNQNCDSLFLQVNLDYTHLGVFVRLWAQGCFCPEGFVWGFDHTHLGFLAQDVFV